MGVLEHSICAALAIFLVLTKPDALVIVELKLIHMFCYLSSVRVASNPGYRLMCFTASLQLASINSLGMEPGDEASVRAEYT